ncbi:MAG: transketolase [Magnetococcales bacterium]|nr:transketolase [Magnetococcales bacterium]
MTHSPATAITGRAIRRIILQQAHRAHVGHIGSGLSVADLLAALYGGVLRIPAPRDPQRDRLILSKGHAALALYAVLHLKGWLDAATLESYCGDDSRLGVHPEFELPGVDFATGSLGMGFSMATGAALAARLQGSERRIYCVVSDAECNEGVVWEAMAFAAQRRLDNLTVLIDLNRQQAIGYTREVLDMSNMAQRWCAFGWQAEELDGHDRAALERALTGPLSGVPRVLVCRTTFGQGVSFMENQIPWHYLPMTPEQYEQALREVENAS